MAFLFEYFRDEYGKKPCDDDTTVIFQLFTGKIHQVHSNQKLINETNLMSHAQANSLRLVRENLLSIDLRLEFMEVVKIHFFFKQCLSLFVMYNYSLKKGKPEEAELYRKAAEELEKVIARTYIDLANEVLGKNEWKYLACYFVNN